MASVKLKPLTKDLSKNKRPFFIGSSFFVVLFCVAWFSAGAYLVRALPGPTILSAGVAQAAGTDYNIRGNAWTNTYGYISFNCLDDDAGGHFPYNFPFQFSTTPCNPNDHGVNIDANSNFSGNAWNATLGLITFNSTTTPPDAYSSTNFHCTHTCNASTNCTACYNEFDEKIYGYAKVVSNGEWIQFDGSRTPQATITNYSAPNPGYFGGFMSSSFGDISLSCDNVGICFSNNYRVYRWPLEMKKLTAPNWNFDQACTSGAAQAVLKWYVNSGQQTAYQIIVNNANNTTSPIYDSGKTTGSARQFICSSASGCPLSYNSRYYFWVRLWDENYSPTSTAWHQFDTSTGDAITDSYLANLSSPYPNLTFTTYKHEFPQPYFTWSPTEAIVGSSTVFTSSAVYYNSANPNSNQITCAGANCGYVWTSTDANALISAATNASTTMTFTYATGTRVYLKATDPDAYYCSTSTLLNVNFVLPTWKEIKATSGQ